MREKELRLALVCYGGVSLAVYMHGITKEIWRFLMASRAYHDGRPVTAGEAVYRDILQDVEDRTGLRLRVLSDILAGSSAGGMNSVFLAQAIVTGQSLEPLTELWLECADADRLMSADARPTRRFAKFWATPIAWAALRQARTLNETVSKEAREEVADKLSRFVRSRWFEPPFGGREFSEMVLDSWDMMGHGPTGPTLLPPGHPLDLFVTMTDFHGHARKLKLHSPPEVSETEHRIVAGFSTRRGRQASLGHPAELTFAARATASFPGAFPPFTVTELDELLADKGIAWPERAEFLRRVLPPAYAGREEEAVLIDGAILANAPFAQAMSALRNRPARREVDRRFIYIDPVPDVDRFHFGRRHDSKNDEQSAVPGFLTTLLGALTNIPRQQPIRDSLEEITKRTQRIERMQTITHNLHIEIDAIVETHFGRALSSRRLSPARIGALRKRSYATAARNAGFAHSAYGHLRLNGLIDDISETVERLREQNPGTAADTRAALWEWAREQGLITLAQRGGKKLNEGALALFRRHDLRYRARRLRFLARRLGEEVEPLPDVSEDAANVMHDMIFDALAMYLERENAEFLGEEMAERAEHAAADPGAFLDALGRAQDLDALDGEVDAMFAAALAPLPDAAARIMMHAYLGFPMFDMATLPLIEPRTQEEFDPIKVDRISPGDANTLRSGGAETVLKGIEFNNFGGFFSRAYRENDYLWGRLHGAERMIDIVFSTLAAKDRPDEPTLRRYKCAAFRAILAEEVGRLTLVGGLIAELDQAISKCEADSTE